MDMWGAAAAQLLWRTALAVVPLTLLVAAICRWLPCRPATRHALWAILLAWLLLSPLLPGSALADRLAAAMMSPSARSGSTAAANATESTAVQPQTDDPQVDIAAAPIPGTDVETEESPRFSPGPLTEAEPQRADEPSDATDFVAPPSLPQHGFKQPILALARIAAAKAIPAVREALIELTEWVRRLHGTRAAANTPALADQSRRRDIDATEDSAESSQRAVESPPAPIGQIEHAPSNDVGPPPPPPKPQWSAWLVGLIAVRESLAQLPLLPATWWSAGIVLLCGGHSVRVLLFLRRLRGATSAPCDVEQLIRRTARRFGLRRAPEALMIGGDVSPMIWCGRRPRLVLPAALWSQLDDVGREAIVCHELAHLRRCDHWLCWGELLAGVIYWWHPLVWWARRRLHEEAELSCDAWVTWLMPQGRRAYAEALLRTNQYVGRANGVGPAVGMAVTRGRTRQFARRLTMVMTESARPRLS